MLQKLCYVDSAPKLYRDYAVLQTAAYQLTKVDLDPGPMENKETPVQHIHCMFFCREQHHATLGTGTFGCTTGTLQQRQPSTTGISTGQHAVPVALPFSICLHSSSCLYRHCHNTFNYSSLPSENLPYFTLSLTCRYYMVITQKTVSTVPCKIGRAHV